MAELVMSFGSVVYREEIVLQFCFPMLALSYFDTKVVNVIKSFFEKQNLEFKF